MIDPNLPEPERRQCALCGRNEGLTGYLIHWPHENYMEPFVKVSNGLTVASFSVWAYECQSCRDIIMSKKRLEERLEQEDRIAAGEEIEAPGFKWVTKGEKGPGVEPGVLTEQDSEPRESIWSYIWHDLAVGTVIVGIVFLVLFLACYS